EPVRLRQLPRVDADQPVREPLEPIQLPAAGADREAVRPDPLDPLRQDHELRPVRRLHAAGRAAHAGRRARQVPTLDPRRPARQLTMATRPHLPHTTRWGLGLAVACVLASSLAAFQARALPRYSARYEQNCTLCHVNPSGGGMRSAYAVKDLIPKEFAMSPATPEMLKDIDPKIGRHLSIGTDFRQLFLLETENAVLAPPQGFFPMQGDLYLLFQLDPKVLLYYNRSLSNTYEFFGLANVLPFDGYVKAGRFVPPYGWKFDDHTLYVRDS